MSAGSSSSRAATQASLSPAFFSPLATAADQPPQLVVVVDTEEEFDWSQPFSRANVGVSAIDEIGRLQTVLERYGVVPTYVIDYPVASTVSSASRLSEMAKSGACHIGAHLHPWVNPPYTETLSARMSYGCNLGLDLEREKIASLKAAIRDHVGVDARVYKAGRYGFGRSTAAILEELAFDIDVSVNPNMDFTDDGGPSFEGFSVEPARFGETRQLLELPCTTGFIGASRRYGAWLHRTASAEGLKPIRAIGLLARSGLLNKVMLSPENSTFDEMWALTKTLCRDGLRTLSLTLHSPSLKPGCTPYVRSVAQRDAFVATIDRYCDYFFTRLSGVATTPADVLSQCKGAL